MLSKLKMTSTLDVLATSSFSNFGIACELLEPDVKLVCLSLLVIAIFSHCAPH